MQIHVAKGGQKFGPYSISELQQQIAAGAFTSTDLGWYEGAASWAPLSSIPGIAAGSVSPPPQPYMTPGVPMPMTNRHPETSGAAIASMICGILAFFTVGITSLPAIICGHIARSKINKSGGAITGGGMAMTGLVLGYIFMVLFGIAIAASLAVPMFAGASEGVKKSKSAINAKQIALACKMYAQDNGGKFPPDLKTLVPDYLSDASVLVSPLDKDKVSIGYDYTTGLTETSPPKQVLLRDKSASRQGYRVVAYVDGSVETKHEQ